MSILHLASNTTVPISSLYSSSPLVIVFLRRWGCQLCRGYASQLQSTLLPTLALNRIAAAAVGFEPQGSDDFHPFFPASSLYLDPQRKAYTALHLQRMPMLSGLMSLLTPAVRAWNGEVRAMGISGNLKGDGMQLGATYVVGPGGQVWGEWKQGGFADHPTAEEILAVLDAHTEGGLKRPGKEGETGQADAVVEERKEGEAGAEKSAPAPVQRLERIGGGAQRCGEDCM